jgi:hypothetical protein
MKPVTVDHAELAAPNRGAAIVRCEDEAYAVVVHRDVGSVSIVALEYPRNAAPKLRLVKEVLLGEGSEP